MRNISVLVLILMTEDLLNELILILEHFFSLSGLFASGLLHSFNLQNKINVNANVGVRRLVTYLLFKVSTEFFARNLVIDIVINLLEHIDRWRTILGF